MVAICMCIKAPMGEHSLEGFAIRELYNYHLENEIYKVQVDGQQAHAVSKHVFKQYFKDLSEV